MALGIAYLLFSLFNYMTFMFIKVDNRHAEALNQQLQAKVAAQENFKMAQITDFAWDTLHVFLPYTSAKTMQETVGTRWATSNSYLGWQLEKRTERLVDDTLMAFVFVKDGQVVCDLTWNVRNGNLLFLADESPYDQQMQVVFTE